MGEFVLHHSLPTTHVQQYLSAGALVSPPHCCTILAAS